MKNKIQVEQQAPANADQLILKGDAEIQHQHAIANAKAKSEMRTEFYIIATRRTWEKWANSEEVAKIFASCVEFEDGCHATAARILMQFILRHPHHSLLPDTATQFQLACMAGDIAYAAWDAGIVKGMAIAREQAANRKP